MSDSNLNIIIGAKNNASGALKGVSSDVEQLGKKAESSEKGFGMLGAAIAGIGIVGVTSEMGKWVAEAKEAERVNAQLNAVLESTKGAAGLTADEVKRMADGLADVTTLDNDVILAGQNMLLTFTNIGEDAFPAATQAMVDMATAMNGGVTPTAEALSNQAIQLGKALNNPTEGMSALTRVGVTFTEEQKKQIEALQLSGDMMGAQKVILDELSKEFGGSATAAAETYTGQLEMLQKSINNVRETMGTHLLAAINGTIEAVTKVVGWLKEHETIAIGLAAAIGTALIPAFIGLGLAIITTVVPAFAALAVAAAPWLLVGAIVGGIVAGIVWIMQNWEMLKGKAAEVFGAIGTWFGGMWQGMTGWAASGLSAIQDMWGTAWGAIASYFSGIITGIQETFNSVIDAIISKIEWVTGKISGAISSVKSLGSSIGGAVGGAVKKVGALSGGRHATGGSFIVPGSGGTDSKLVAMNVTPGERVTVETPGQQQGTTVRTNIFDQMLAVLEQIRDRIGNSAASLSGAAAKLGQVDFSAATGKVAGAAKNLTDDLQKKVSAIRVGIIDREQERIKNQVEAITDRFNVVRDIQKDLIDREQDAIKAKAEAAINRAQEMKQVNNITVQGSVLTQRELVDLISNALSRNVSLRAA